MLRAIEYFGGIVVTDKISPLLLAVQHQYCDERGKRSGVQLELVRGAKAAV
ncbi:MAG: hypothetical protein Q7J42_18415 [Sulfuritalea sp.]|nr:hypothetical protein [Sulfuritalea sp.]